MSVTLDGIVFNDLYLTEQPFGYDEKNTQRGRTAGKWLITGFMTPADWLDLLYLYDTWRDLKILEDDPSTTGLVGATVTLSCSGPGGQTFNSIECWFNSAPTGTQSGIYLNASFELINAAEALQVLLAEKEEQEEETEDLPDFGTITIGTTTLILRKPVNTYGPGPSMELTATGVHLITGPLVVYRIKDVEGETNLTGFNDIRSWYESQIVAVPNSGSYFPITPPTATAERKVISGVVTDVYTVSIQLGQVI
jgi:hypothetical protein